ncbi:ADI_G0033120.mRNA.1.CDS.1 [Saccharomyces cerevisiae]|uniref:YJL127Cp-like protein n=3 Tax=Saccharomyces cerevisiae TaxID=4932 RepID=B5VL52_YEAS6|nr:Spt10p [Saccharomyces cerevisiae YJM993]AJP39584.1 Spt10p [Saccharomyces cerevisiae YJM1078]AJR54180.1 Spt10p [Saccharomyces cerevisiae YJM682]AJR54514.1 Spt10p [Saccharomyces cerevisiae YJM683]AJR55478.1 Spt10p [Saccharomyces cerevisiae YJM969]AJR55806.1 Spt10p [Saccharomyces cerevisiae YJM972]AJR56135.1 Spt10p [Saccharomyces cerevisiae YJM975]AJR56460.1 Spt10p [Saccharomyces cerevisiae YJM978]AJR56787.1 Spt10p [Saccharomyces cerevisiae YJM981]AJR57115.1 Spt10p [Saccharomyces cerevisia
MLNQHTSSVPDDEHLQMAHQNSSSEVRNEAAVPDQLLTPLQPYTILLKDGETIATMYPIPAYPDLLPLGLLNFLLDEFNMEVEKGDSFPYYETLSLEEFKNVWFHNDGHVCIMVLGEIPELDYSMDTEADTDDNFGTEIETTKHTTQYKKRKERRNLNLSIQWEKQCLGIFDLKPAYPGRSAHVVTGTFLVNAGIRGKGIGKTLVETFIEWSKKLGFTSSFFPLIYGTNVGIRRILEGLNFRRIGKLPEAGILKGFDVPVDSFMYGKEFTHITKSIDLLRDPQKSIEIGKYERLKHFLETGKYPLHCDRNEKARLRVLSKTHSVLNGKLMTKGKEIIYDTDQQIQIALEIHLMEHLGINKVTSKIGEKYHWRGIKSTVSEVISRCQKCKMRYKDGTGVIIEQKRAVKQAHMLPTQHIETINNPRKSKKHDNALLGQAINFPQNIISSTLNDVEGEPTPPDTNIVQPTFQNATNSPATTAEANEANKRSEFLSSIQSTPLLDDEQSMNSFNRFVEEENSRKRRKYLDVASNGIVPHLTNNESQDHANPVNRDERDMNHSVPDLDRNDHTIMNDAMLSLEDNVMAALEMVQKEQQQKINHRGEDVTGQQIDLNNSEGNENSVTKIVNNESNTFTEHNSNIYY